MVTESGAKVTFLLDHGKSDALGSKLSPKNVAAALKKSRGTLSDWKNGKQPIIPDHWPTLAALFHFSADWPEWATGTAAAFEARYRREVLKQVEDDGYRKDIRHAMDELRVLRDQGHPSLHNYFAEIERFFEPALASAAKSLAEMNDIDLELLRSFQKRLQEGYRLSGATQAARGGLAAKLAARIASLVESLTALAREGADVPLDAEMRAQLEAALEEAKALLRDPDRLDAALRQSLEHFIRVGESALDCGHVDLSELDGGSALLRRYAGQRFARGARAVMVCIGGGIRNSGKMPAYVTFTDGPEDWMPEMIALPLGSFAMGSPDSDPEANSNEKPQHEVEIAAPVALARYPLTFDEYDAFCAATQRAPPKDRYGRGRMPVTHVSWEDARDYCDWLAQRSGAAYRLPSEAEWEYACRAGTETRYWWGDDWDPARANGADSVGKTSEIGSYDPNPWGLHDSHGNVWEWCEDVYEGGYETSRTQQAFTANGESSRVVRGGSWLNLARYCRSAYRNGNAPDNRFDSLGFRPARGQAGSSGRPAAEPPED